jgi:cytochrome c oxidase cbb3-type subunit III
MSKNSENLTGHSYDGIEEYDNPTPGWWTWLFIMSVIFSIFYYLIVNIAAQGKLSPAAYHDREQAEYTKRQFGELVDVKPDNASIMKLTAEERWISAGAAVFQTNCVSCHGRNAEGVVSSCPNLTDEFFIHVRKLSDIPDVISIGRNNGAMPAWNTRLYKEEILVVSAYVASLRGKNLPGKPREDNAIEIPKWSAE